MFDLWLYVTRHDISRLMEVKRHKEKNVVKVSRCETGHLSHRQLHFLCTVPIAKDIHAYYLSQIYYLHISITIYQLLSAIFIFSHKI